MPEIENLDDDLEDIGDDALGLGGGGSRFSGLLTRRNIVVIGAIVAVVLGAVLFFAMSDDEDSSRTSAQQFEKGNNSNRQFQKQLQAKKKQKKKKKRRQKKIKYVILYKQLTAEQLTPVLREFSYEGIQFNVIQNGKQFDVGVDEAKVEEAKVMLAVKGLPTGQIKGFELFDDASNLGVTEFDKRIRLIRAISGEMEKAIMKFEAFDNAQVEIVIPEPRLFTVKQPPVTASILVRKSGDVEVTDGIVFAIIQMTSNSVENLMPENISVVDTQGNVLSIGVVEGMQERRRVEKIRTRRAKTQDVKNLKKMGRAVEPSIDDVVEWFELKTNYEAMLEQKAIQQLVGVLPKGSYKVAVTVDLNTAKKGGAPDIKGIVTSVVVDSGRDDLTFDNEAKKQVKNAVSGAVGFKKGRDSILMSTATFVKKSVVAKKKKDKKKKDKKKSVPSNIIPLKEAIQYWPIPAMGLGLLTILFVIYRLFKAIVKGLLAVGRAIARIPSRFKRDKVKKLKVEEAQVEDELLLDDNTESPFDEVIETPQETEVAESNIDTLSEIATNNPEVIANLLDEWYEVEGVTTGG